MSVHQAIHHAEALLPGEAAAEGDPDPRWQAIIAVGEYVETDPEAVWQFTRTWGSHPQLDLSDAIATCLLEHLLEYHFAVYFPQVEQLTRADPRFADTFLKCAKFGQAEQPDNAVLFDHLWQRLR